MKQRRKKKKRIKRNEDNLRDLWNNVKRPNIQVIGVPEEEDKKNPTWEFIFQCPIFLPFLLFMRFSRQEY